MSRTLFIVNPLAGGKRGLRRWKEFARNLSERGFRYEWECTACRGHAHHLANLAVRSGVSDVVAFGGDGTLNEVLNGFMQVPSRRRSLTRLGFVPAGSSNDFLRSLGISTPSSVEHCTEGKPMVLDVGTIECRNAEGGVSKRYFLVNASIGALPGALEFFNRQTLANRILKRISLDLTVVASGLNSILKHTTCSYGLSIEENSTIEGRFTNLSVLRGVWFGGGMSYGTEAIPPPGFFSLVGINDMSIAGRLLILPRFYTGTMLKHPAVWKRKCTNVEITSESSSIVEADGELVGFLPAKFTVLPRSLTIVVWKEQS